MDKKFSIQVGRRGVITFPKELRQRNQIQEGDLLNLFEVSDGVFILSKETSKIDQLANQLKQDWQSSDISLESMLSALREVREDYHAQKD